MSRDCMLRKIWLEDMVRVTVVLTRWKKSSSAVLNSYEMTGISLCSSPTVCCDVATNQDVRGRQLNTCQTTMVPRTGCTR